MTQGCPKGGGRGVSITIINRTSRHEAGKSLEPRKQCSFEAAHILDFFSIKHEWRRCIWLTGILFNERERDWFMSNYLT